MVNGHVGSFGGSKIRRYTFWGSGKDCTVKSDEDHVTMIPATI